MTVYDCHAVFEKCSDFLNQTGVMFGSGNVLFIYTSNNLRLCRTVPSKCLQNGPSGEG